MAPHDRIIQRLCQNSFTRHEAKRLYSIGFQRTGKHTGHDLGDGHGALAEICALLASEKTGMGDVTPEQARASACLDRKTFDAALEIVRRVISKSTAPDLKRVTYNSLVRQHGVREDASVAMLEVADALKQSGTLDNTQLHLESPVVQCAIFYWVSTKVFELTVPDFLVYREQHRFSQKAWSLVIRLLNEHCSRMVEKLSALAKTAAPSLQTHRVTRAQAQRSPLILPSNNRHPLDNVSPQKSLVNAMKGQVRKEPPNAREDETPRKRHKGRPSPLGTDLKTNTYSATKECATPPAKGSRGIVIGSKRESKIPTETIVVSRKKSVQHADTTAWEEQRLKLALMHSTPTQASPPKRAMFPDDMNSTNNTPMTSTGMSDACSEPSPSASRRVIRTRFRSPAGLSLPSDEETPRHRRRNLRAPFLNHEAYTWTPSARTKERLERGRILEALMISKHGDPWNDLHEF